MREFTGDERAASRLIGRRILMTVMSLVIIAVTDLAPLETNATVVTPPPAILITNGSLQIVASGPGDQIDPHVSCNLASYTNDTGAVREIHLFRFRYWFRRHDPNPRSRLSVGCQRIPSCLHQRDREPAARLLCSTLRPVTRL